MMLLQQALRCKTLVCAHSRANYYFDYSKGVVRLQKWRRSIQLHLNIGYECFCSCTNLDGVGIRGSTGKQSYFGLFSKVSIFEHRNQA